MRLSEQQRARAAAIKEQLEQLTAGVQARGDQNMTPEETAQFDQLLAERKDALKRAAELEEMEAAEDRAAEVRKEAGETGEQRTAPVEVNEPDIYERGGRNSFFRDLVMAEKRQDMSASERLSRHARHASETRAIGNTNAAGGSGGEWAPPSWMVSDWINLIRPSRVTADLFRHENVPFGTASS